MPFGSWIIVLLNLWITLSILRSSDVSNGIPKLGDGGRFGGGRGGGHSGGGGRGGGHVGSGAEPGGGLNPIMISNAALLFSPGEDMEMVASRNNGSEKRKKR